MIFARKMPEFFIIIAEKYFFPNFRGTCPLPPVSYAYDTARGVATGVDIGIYTPQNKFLATPLDTACYRDDWKCRAYQKSSALFAPYLADVGG